MKFRLSLRRIIWGTTLGLVLLFFYFVFVVFHKVFTPKDVSKMKPETLFHWLVCNPMPPSVTNFQAKGTLMFTGHSVWMEFNIAPADFDTMITIGGFKRIEQPFSDPWSERLTNRLTAPEFYEKRGGASDDNHNITQVTLITSTNHSQVFVDYFRP